MSGRLTHAKATAYRAEALELFREAKAVRDHPSAEAQRKRIEFLDEYLASNLRRNGATGDATVVKTFAETTDGPRADG